MSERSIDDELLARYRNAEFRGFDLFYRRNQAIIFAFLLSRLVNRSDAEEAFQETFFRIHKSILSFDVSQKALPWVFTIARNVAIDIIRKRKKHASHSAIEGSVTPRTEQALIAREKLQEVMSHLTVEECSLIEERFLNDADFESIAIRQGSTAATTRQKLSRLLKRIRS